jgi:hypothetical protein
MPPPRAAEAGGEEARDRETGKLEDGSHEPGEGDQELEGEGERQARAPWHFKVIAVATVVYLGWRLYQGIGWLAHHIH